MDSRYNDPVCFICGNPEATISSDTGGPKRYSCPRCAEYTIAGRQSAGDIERCEEFFVKAPAIAREKAIQKRDGYTISWNDEKNCACIGDVPFLENYPKTFPAKLNRILLNIARMADFSPLYMWELPVDDLGLLFLDEPNASLTNQMASLLHKQGWVEFHGNGATGTVVQLTLKGIDHALELDKSTDNPQAFLAMWFSETTKQYRKSVQQAAEEAGYILNPVDEVPHNEPIMDKVLNLINEAHFVVADLTCEPEDCSGSRPHAGVRGGVYYEAGYAKGQGKQVILTCRDTPCARSRIHFDLQQVNTIFWNEANGLPMVGDQTLTDVLRERILFTIGKGPLYNRATPTSAQ